MYRFIVFEALIGILGAVIAFRKGRNPFFWGLVCFIFPLLIFVIGIAPPLIKSGKTKQCPDCKRVLQKTDTNCRYCGKEMPINLIQCRECGSFVPEGDYCVQCNRKRRA